MLSKPRPLKLKESLLLNSKMKKVMKIEDYSEMIEKRSVKESFNPIHGKMTPNLTKTSNACEISAGVNSSNI